MGLIAGYIFMGSVLFSVWEGWDWLKAAYYCFITISTIGFGDVVPGSAGFHTMDDQLKMLGAACYMIFGMAILSMAFNLIQEEIVSKFMWLGEKLGIVAKPKEDPNNEDMLDAKLNEGNENNRASLASNDQSELGSVKPLPPQMPVPFPIGGATLQLPPVSYGEKGSVGNSPGNSPRAGDKTKLITGSPLRAADTMKQSHL